MNVSQKNAVVAHMKKIVGGDTARGLARQISEYAGHYFDEKMLMKLIERKCAYFVEHQMPTTLMCNPSTCTLDIMFVRRTFQGRVHLRMQAQNYFLANQYNFYDNYPTGSGAVIDIPIDDPDLTKKVYEHFLKYVYGGKACQFCMNYAEDGFMCKECANEINAKPCEKCGHCTGQMVFFENQHRHEKCLEEA